MRKRPWVLVDSARAGECHKRVVITLLALQPGWNPEIHRDTDGVDRKRRCIRVSMHRLLKSGHVGLAALLGALILPTVAVWPAHALTVLGVDLSTLLSGVPLSSSAGPVAAPVLPGSDRR